MVVLFMLMCLSLGPTQPSEARATHALHALCGLLVFGVVFVVSVIVLIVLCWLGVISVRLSEKRTFTATLRPGAREPRMVVMALATANEQRELRSYPLMTGLLAMVFQMLLSCSAHAPRRVSPVWHTLEDTALRPPLHRSPVHSLSLERTTQPEAPLPEPPLRPHRRSGKPQRNRSEHPKILRLKWAIRSWAPAAAVAVRTAVWQLLLRTGTKGGPGRSSPF